MKIAGVNNFKCCPMREAKSGRGIMLGLRGNADGEGPALQEQ